MNPWNVTDILGELLRSGGYVPTKTAITEDERNCAAFLLDVIDQWKASHVITEETLDIDEHTSIEAESFVCDEVHEPESASSISSPEESSGDENEEIPQKEKSVVFYSRNEKLEMLKYWLNVKNQPTLPQTFAHRTMSAMKNRFRTRCPARCRLYEWKRQWERGELMSVKEKFNRITMHVTETFKQRRQEGRCVHDADIKMWAKAKAIELNFRSFHASDSWVLRWKRKNNIVSRKVKSFITVRTYQSRDDIRKSVEDWQQATRALMTTYADANIYNADESGFHKEMTVGRTLAVRGSTDIVGVVQSVHATTHTYTIMPLLSPTGKLAPKLFVILQEPRSLSAQIRQSMFAAPNLIVHSHSSGKMTKELFRRFLQEAVVEQISGEKLLLILDSYGPHKDASVLLDLHVQNNLPEDKITTHIIPPNTTSMCQPLDLHFFRMYKHMVRKISDAARDSSEEISLQQRNNLLMLQSLTYNQLCSPRFYNSHRHGWVLAKLVDEPRPFETSTQFCFQHKLPFCNLQAECSNMGFIKCAWCTKVICFKHFFVHNHYCETFVPD